MSNDLLASKVVVYEETPGKRTIKPAATSVVGALGVAERGPIGVPVWVTEETFPEVFGDFTLDSDLALSVRAGFFKNAKAGLWVVRTCHYSDPTNPASIAAVKGAAVLSATGVEAPAYVIGAEKAPFRLNPGDQLVLSEGGHADDIVAFAAGPASVDAVNAGPYALADGQTLQVIVDKEPVQEITLKSKNFADITAATPEEVSQVVNSALFGGKAVTDGGPPSLVSDTLGTSSRIQVVGGTANAALGFPTTPSTGMGNVADIRQVTIAEVKVAVEAQVPEVVVEPVAVMSGYQMLMRTTDLGAFASLQVQPGTAAAFGFDNSLHQGSDAGVLPLLRVDAKDPGEYANRLQVETRAATSGEAGLFDLLVFDDGVAAGRFVNLSIDPDHPRYVEAIVNDEASGSHLIRVAVQPHPTGAVPEAQTVQLAGGDDGLKNLDDNDFVGTKAGKTGLYAFDGVLDLSVLCVPGRATPVVHNAVIQYCEVERDGLVFPVLDPPSGASADGVIDYFKASAGLQNLTEDGAFYWSWPKVGNPSRAVFGSSETVEVPPSGMICGVYVRNDGAKPGGIYTPPGGVENGKLFGVVGVQDEAVLDETVRNRIYPERINPISRESGTPFFLDGTRTMKGDGQFPYIHQKRGVIFIRRSLKESLVFARHRTNNERLQQEVFRTVKSFMRAQQKNEGVVAFAVEISTDNSRTLSGRLRLLMPEATDWVVIGISQDPDLLGEQLAS